jgi:hypothetical protein
MKPLITENRVGFYKNNTSLSHVVYVEKRKKIMLVA